MILFADDLKIYSEINNISDCIRLQECIDRLFDWCVGNDLELNVSKCLAMRYTYKRNFPELYYKIGNSKLDEVSNVKDLGVWFDTTLKFDIHISQITNRANKLLGFIMRMSKDFTNIRCIKTLYTSLVRPILEYASTIWSPFRVMHTQSIKPCQKRFTRFLFFKSHTQYLQYYDSRSYSSRPCKKQ